MSPSQNVRRRPRRQARSKTMSVSERASPGGGTTGWPQLDQRLRLRADLEADLQRLALEGGGDRQHHVGQLGGGVHEQVGVGVEVERGQRLAPVPDVGMGQQHVGAEADQRRAPGRAAAPEWRGRDRGRDVSPSAPARAAARPGPAPGPCCRADGRSSPVIGAADGTANSTLPPRRVEAAGERVEQRRWRARSGWRWRAARGRSRRSRRPGARARSAARPPRSVGARNPADRLDRLGRVAPAERGVELEGRVAHDLALRRRDDGTRPPAPALSLSPS